MIKVGIIGGAGYTGGEATRILINHPEVKIEYIHSNSNGGNYVYDVHTDLLGDTTQKFTDAPIAELPEVDAMFLCVGHGDARKFLENNTISSQTRIIDLSQDFRIAPNTTMGEREFIYGLPEMNREQIRSARNVANPGCFATCLQLALLPLAASGLLNDDVHISATTGSTGAGQSLSPTSHFSWRANNFSVYKAFTHQHLKEVNQMITNNQEYSHNVNFIPYRGDFTRGILAGVYTKFNGTIEQARSIYENFYETHPFTWLSAKNINLKQVVNTNKAIISLEKEGDNLLIVTAIDNLLKGASGQAVQNMNIMFSLDESCGLKLKPVGF
ncbi:N-acetyl-gamma-glutamyl-phosphate reductase [Mucinivorans hirudinis]|uniref:N-acetyl-gamma-glutamyl-phosphate reductase n=1 Tax=Mucinivorans hirudinis TaxID=1433126 RepID=A0A060R607_9BACT|nr:N-acetyl-gamma-glutamyl-phosphate reductase [Mucinivorans hirudinis]